MAKSPKAAEPAAETLHPREAIVTALMQLAAENAFERITISQICEKAEVSLAQFRELFPSKGAILGAYSRAIDLKVLRQSAADLIDEPAKDRLFDVLMRRLDAMSPDKAALESVVKWARREPLAAVALNQVALNSMRFMLEAAGIDSEGPLGTLKLQGLAIAWTRIMDTWFKDDSPDLGATMAELDKVLTRGGKVLERAQDMDNLFVPLRTMARALCNTRRDMGTRMRERWAPERGDDGTPA